MIRLLRDLPTIIKKSYACAISSYGNLSIKRQLALSLLVVIMPFALMGIITYNNNMNIVSRILSDNKLLTLEETAKTVDQFIYNIESKALQVGWDSDVQRFLSKDESKSNYEDFELATNACNSINKLALATSVETLVVVPCLHKGFTLTKFGGKGFLSQEYAMQFDWYSSIVKESSVPLWIPYTHILQNPLFSAPRVTYIAPVKMLYSPGEVAGHVMVSVNRKAIDDIVSARSAGNKETIFLIDGEYNLISSSDESYNESFGKIINLNRQKQAEGWYYAGTGKEKFLITYTTLPRYGWQLISMVSVSSISTELMDLSKMMYVIIVLCVFISLVLAVAMYRAVTKPMDFIVKRMISIASGDFSEKPADAGTKNELKKIFTDFNWMSGRIAHLIEQNNEAVQQKKEAEFAALQAQINPHFLYNVLDTINWMAILKDEEDISQAITSLSNFYRSILNDGKDTVTIRQEIEHVKAYVEIEKLRYKNGFTVTFKLDESLFHLHTTKFILQPFVENALIHGFDYSRSTNNIEIALQEEAGIIRFEISDNGEGMTQDKLRQVMANEAKGYGIANVDERIKLKYGAQYGVSITSIPGGGTVVRISFPKMDHL